MAAPVSHFKLGLFAIAALAGLTAVAFGLGLRRSRTPSTMFHTYFDESVDGLDVGDAVKYRGVRIGSVSAVDIAPDGHLVDVTLAIAANDATRFQLAAPPLDLRTQIATQGITGIKIVDLDFADPATNPPPVLAFAPPLHYLPSRPSLVKRVEDEADSLGRDLPVLAHDGVATLHRLDGAIDDFEQQHVAARVAALVDRTGGVIDDTRALLRHASATTVAANHVLDRVGGDDGLGAAARRALDRLGGNDGVFASAQRATDSVGELGRRTLESTDELARTLHDVGDAARALRDFVDALDREPDMLVKGRAPARGP